MTLSTCTYCGGAYTVVEGCAVPYPHAHLYGDEPFAIPDPVERCYDCAARLGHPHHRDCLNAWCATCGDQAACCPHNLPPAIELLKDPS